MRYEFHPEALDEYNEPAHYYAERQPGLDLRFIVSVAAYYGCTRRERHGSA